MSSDIASPVESAAGSLETRFDNPVKGLIFTVGCQRSGTSMVHRLVSEHPEVQGVFTEWGLIFDRYDDLAKYTGIKDPKSAADVIKALGLILDYSHHQKWGLEREDYADLAERFQPGWDAVFLTAVAAKQRKSGDRLVAIKCPEREHCMSQLKTLFDGIQRPIRFVYCVRHPFDVYLSWKHRSFSWRDRDDADPRPVRWCNSWLKSTAGFLSAKYLYPDLLTLVRFEDVVRSPESEVNRLCDHLHLQPCVDQMVKGLDSHQANSSFDNSEHESKVSGGVIDMSVRARDLDDWEADAIRSLCADRASLFGYNLGRDVSRKEARTYEHQAHLESVPTGALLKHGGRIIVRRVRASLTRRKLR